MNHYDEIQALRETMAAEAKNDATGHGAGPDVRECSGCYHASHDTRTCKECTRYFCLDCMKPEQAKCWECDNGPSQANADAWSGGIAENH